MERLETRRTLPISLWRAVVVTDPSVHDRAFSTVALDYVPLMRTRCGVPAPICLPVGAWRPAPPSWPFCSRLTVASSNMIAGCVARTGELEAAWPTLRNSGRSPFSRCGGSTLS